jgi:predicted transcriptional regulator
MNVSAIQMNPCEQKEWQLGEVNAAIRELDSGHAVSHDKVAAWLNSWGSAKDKKAPR